MRLLEQDRSVKAQYSPKMRLVEKSAREPQILRESTVVKGTVNYERQKKEGDSKVCKVLEKMINPIIGPNIINRL